MKPLKDFIMTVTIWMPFIYTRIIEKTPPGLPQPAAGLDCWLPYPGKKREEGARDLQLSEALSPVEMNMWSQSNLSSDSGSRHTAGEDKLGNSRDRGIPLARESSVT